MKVKFSNEILLKPIVTEKSLKAVDELNQYSFLVSQYSEKNDVKKEVERRFKVKVEKVRIVRIKGKTVSMGRKRIRGRRKSIKKAIVTLKSGDNIDLFKVK